MHDIYVCRTILEHRSCALNAEARAFRPSSLPPSTVPLFEENLSVSHPLQLMRYNSSISIGHIIRPTLRCDDVDNDYQQDLITRTKVVIDKDDEK